MAPPGNRPRPRRSPARRLPREAELAAALRWLCRGRDQDVLTALVTLVRDGDVEALRACRVILGLTLRVARRNARRDMDPLTAGPWRPR